MGPSKKLLRRAYLFFLKNNWTFIKKYIKESAFIHCKNTFLVISCKH